MKASKTSTSRVRNRVKVAGLALLLLGFLGLGFFTHSDRVEAWTFGGWQPPSTTPYSLPPNGCRRSGSERLNWNNGSFRYKTFGFGIEGNNAFTYNPSNVPPTFNPPFRMWSEVPNCSGDYDMSLSGSPELIHASHPDSIVSWQDGAHSIIPWGVEIGTPTHVNGTGQNFLPAFCVPQAPDQNPPNSQCNYGSHASFNDDSGRMVIGAGGFNGGPTGDRTIYCIGLQTDITFPFIDRNPPGYADCPPDILTIGVHRGSGSLFRTDVCNQVNIYQGGPLGDCNARASWYSPFLGGPFNTDFTNQIGKLPNGVELDAFYMHYDSTNTHTGGFGAGVNLTFRYPLNRAQCIQVSGIPAVIERGQTYTVSVTMQNTGQRWWSQGTGHRLLQQGSLGNIDINMPTNGTYVNGNAVTFTYNVTIPIDYPSVDLDLGWQMKQIGATDSGETGWTVPACGVDYDVVGYPFDLYPQVSGVPTRVVAGAVVTATYTVENRDAGFSRDNNDLGVPYEITGGMGTGSGRVIVPGNSVAGVTSPGPFTIPPSAQPGDRFCTRLRVNPATGRDGVAFGNDPRETEVCTIVVGRPLVHSFGSDVWAGGSFTDRGSGEVIDDITQVRHSADCVPADGHDAFIQTVFSNPRGSFTQYAAYAMGVVDDFGSQGTPGAGGGVLTFANYPAGNSGNYTNDGRCILDYYGYLSHDASDGVDVRSVNNLNLASLGRGQYFITPPSGTLRIFGSGLINSPVTVIVDGNVRIEQEVRYNNGYNVATPDNVPFLLLTASGNIDIQGNVTELYGVYQTKGVINTCSDVAPTAPLSSGVCNNLLNVRGMFIADKVLLRRTFDDAVNNRPAERFTVNPELYLAKPVIINKSGLIEPSFESRGFNDLPPVF